MADLFLTVQHVSKVLERVYNASSLNIAIQDGSDAGQSVPHVHAHIIPRRQDDLKEKGGSDAIYDMLDSEDGDLESQLKERAAQRRKFPAVDADQNRKSRSESELKAEADWLSQEMKMESNVSKDASSKC